MVRLRLLLITACLCATLAAWQPPPLPSAIPGSQLVETSRVDGPLEVRAARADSEAVLAGLSYTRQRYSAPRSILVDAFVVTYRDALFAAGWKLLDVPRLDVKPLPEGIVNVGAQYMNNGRNIYARISRAPDGAYEINFADVGAEDWAGALAKGCRVPIHSLHFELNRPALRVFESTPTLEKLASLLKASSAPAVEIQGHMDNVGESGVAERQQLSEARARAVAEWLFARGVPTAKVSAKGYGKARPIADNDTDLGRALNRRIEIACQPVG